MAERETIRLYVLSVEDRCPRCLRKIDPATAVVGEQLADKIVCPKCEAILDVCEVEIIESDDGEVDA